MPTEAIYSRPFDEVPVDLGGNWLKKSILVTVACMVMVAMAVPGASGPIQFGHAWGTEFADCAYAVEVDSRGNVYLSGTVFASDSAAFVAKVDIYGKKMWDILLSSPTNDLYVYDVALGPSGSLYVVGQYVGINAYEVGTFYAKVDSSGSLVYQKYLPDLDIPNRMCTNAARNGFVIVGDTDYYGTGAIVSITDDGRVDWARSAESPDGESPWAAVTDSSGSVYVFIDSCYDSNVAIAKFSKTGRLVLQSVLLTSSEYEYTWDLAIGPDGNIYALGANYGDGILLLASFTPMLDLIWDEYVRAPTGGYEASRLVVNSDGSLCAIGYSTWTGAPAVFHMSTSGAVLEATVYEFDMFYGSFDLFDASPHPSGGIVVAGQSYGFPKATPVSISGVEVVDIPGAWEVDSVDWSKAILTSVPGDIVSEDVEGAMDNYDAGQGSQAWYGIMDPLPPAFESNISVKTTQDPYVISFRASASGGRSPYAYEWYFGDGFKASGSKVTHEYAMGGNFEVLLVVTDAKGMVSWATACVSLPAYPVITSVSHHPEPAYVGDTVWFDVSAYDPDGGPLSYLWSFGDGASDATLNPYTNHSYSAEGVYDCWVTVTDDEGLSISALEPVSVMNKAPIAVFNYYPPDPYALNSVTFDASLSYDPDGSIVSYSWDFGDMTTETGVIAYHAYSSPGTYFAGLTVCDNSGATGFMGVNVTVRPREPVASFSARVVGSIVYVNASSSTAAAGIVSYAWDWGDGSPVEVFTNAWASHTYSTETSTETALPLVESVNSVVVDGFPIPPYYVFGYVTTLEGSLVFGCSVSITNMRTGVTADTTTDMDYGFYMYDLNTMYGGWMNGDVIRVFAIDGVMEGVGLGVADASTAFLWIDVVVEPTGPVVCYTVTLTVTDALGQTDSTSLEVWVRVQ